MKINNKLIGEQILKFRLKKNLFQKDLAQQVGISPNSLSRIERGDTQISINLLLKIANVLNIDVDILLRGNITYVIEKKSSGEFDIKINELYDDLLRKNREQKENFSYLLDNYLKILKS